MMADSSDHPDRRGPAGATDARNGSLQPDFEQELRHRLGRGLQSEYARALLEPLPPRVLQLLSVLERIASTEARRQREESGRGEDDPGDEGPR